MARVDLGAGVILVENYNNNYTSRGHREIGPYGSDIASYAFVLFRNAATEKYTDGGGRFDASDINLQKTAVRELKEESCNLFRLSPSTLDNAIKTVHTVGHQEYHGFFLRIDNPRNTFTKDYNYNHELLSTRGAPPAWLETNAICRVYIWQLLFNDVMTSRGDLHTLDSLFNPIIIDGKTKALIRMYLQYLGLDKESPHGTVISQIEGTRYVRLEYNDNCMSRSHPLVNHTRCYWI